MALTRSVKVGNISNLSDARYCAGMGVDLLGFGTIAGRGNYIAPKQFQEVRGWITGPRVIAEIYGFKDATELAQVLESYRPDLLELSIDELNKLDDTPLPLIVRITAAEISVVMSHPLRKKVEFLLISDFKNDGEVLNDIRVLLELTTITLEEIKPQYFHYGIALSGSIELRPGLKTYDDLADILEKLDVD